MIRSFPSTWEHLGINLTHNENIKTFDDIARHVELEEDRFLTFKPYGEAYMTESKKIRASGSGRKEWKGKVIKLRRRGGGGGGGGGGAAMKLTLEETNASTKDVQTTKIRT